MLLNVYSVSLENPASIPVVVVMRFLLIHNSIVDKFYIHGQVIVLGKGIAPTLQ